MRKKLPLILLSSVMGFLLGRITAPTEIHYTQHEVTASTFEAAPPAPRIKKAPAPARPPVPRRTVRAMATPAPAPAPLSQDAQAHRAPEIDATIEKARTLVEEKDPEQAIQLLEIALRANPGNEPLTFELAHLYETVLRQPERAQELLSKLESPPPVERP